MKTHYIALLTGWLSIIAFPISCSGRASKTTSGPDVSGKTKTLALAQYKFTAIGVSLELAASQGVMTDVEGQMQGRIGPILVSISSSLVAKCEKTNNGQFNITISDSQIGQERHLVYSQEDFRAFFGEELIHYHADNFNSLLSTDEWNRVAFTFETYKYYIHYLVDGYAYGFVDSNLPFEDAIRDMKSQWGIEVSPQIQGHLSIKYKYPDGGDRRLTMVASYNGTKILDWDAEFRAVFPRPAADGRQVVEGEFTF